MLEVSTGQIAHMPCERSPLGVEIASAYARARQLTGYSRAKFFDACSRECGILGDVVDCRRELGYTSGDDFMEKVEGGALIPSSLFLVVAARIAGVGLSVLFVQPDEFDAYAALRHRVEALELARRPVVLARAI